MSYNASSWCKNVIAIIIVSPYSTSYSSLNVLNPLTLVGTVVTLKRHGFDFSSSRRDPFFTGVHLATVHITDTGSTSAFLAVGGNLDTGLACSSQNCLSNLGIDSFAVDGDLLIGIFTATSSTSKKEWQRSRGSPGRGRHRGLNAETIHRSRSHHQHQDH